MRMAKDALDVGLLTDDEAMLGFFEHEIGLAPPERLRVGPGVVQHRFAFEGSVLKVSLVASLPSEARSGYASVVLASDELGSPGTRTGPDDVRVEIVPPGEEAVTRLGVRLRVPDAEASRSYFRDVLGWDVVGDVVRVASTVVLLEQDADAPAAVRMPVRGWTYLTVQVFDCDGVTDDVVSRGAALAAEPRTMGDVARFSMVADRYGNQLEISERASVTGAPIGSARRST